MRAIEHASGTGDLTSKDLSNTLAPQQLSHLLDQVVKLQAKGWATVGISHPRLLSAAVGPTKNNATVKACVSSDAHFIIKKTGKPVVTTVRPLTIETATLVLLDGKWKFASETIEQVSAC